MSPVDVREDAEHLLMNRFDDILMKVRGKGSIMFRRKELLVCNSIGYIGHDEI
jgi:hypothetical protein